MAAKLLTTEQVNRACQLVAVRKQLVERLKPAKKKAASRSLSLSDYIWGLSVSRSSDHQLPDDVVRKSARLILQVIDAELLTLGVKP